MKKTKEEVEKLNKEQHEGIFHPYTCCGYNGCIRSEQDDDGILVATEECWVCPCGKYNKNTEVVNKIICTFVL